MARRGAERAVAIVHDFLVANLPAEMTTLSADVPTIGLAGESTIALAAANFYQHAVSPSVECPGIFVYANGERELSANRRDRQELEFDLEVVAVVPYTAADTLAQAEAAAYRLAQGIRGVMNGTPRLSEAGVDDSSIGGTQFPRGAFGDALEAIFVVTPVTLRYHPDNLSTE